LALPVPPINDRQPIILVKQKRRIKDDAPFWKLTEPHEWKLA